MHARGTFFYMKVISGLVSIYFLVNPIFMSGDYVLSNNVSLDSKDNLMLDAFVGGAVDSPGVYSIKTGSTLLDLIELAGGFSRDADIEYVHKSLNLSRSLEQEDHVFVPKIELNKHVQDTSYSNNSFDINTVAFEELVSISGIGEKTAQKIINGRPYQSIEDIKDIDGIGDVTYSKLVNHF